MSSFLARPLPVVSAIFVALALLTGPSFAAPRGTQDSSQDKTKTTQAKEKEQASGQSQTNVEITVTAPRVEIPLKKNPAATTVVETPILQAMPRKALKKTFCRMSWAWGTSPTSDTMTFQTGWR